MPQPDADPPPLAERLDAISEALARLVREQRELAAKQDELAARLYKLEGGAVPNPVRQTPPPLPLPPPPPFEGVAPPAPLLPNDSHDPEIETRLGLNWLNRVGVVTLLFGVAFFFKLAVDNQWIGPSARVALGVVAAMLSLVGGEWMFIRKQKVFAQGLTGLGVALLYLSFYASFGFYHLLSQQTAFLLMLFATLSAGFLSLHYSSQAVALLALTGGFLTPVLLSTGENHLGILTAYTSLLNLGACFFFIARKWSACAYLALAATWLMFAGWSSDWLSESTRLSAFGWLTTIFLVFFAASVVTKSLTLLLPNVAFYFYVSYFVLNPGYHNWLGTFAVVVGVLHGLLAAREWNQHKNFAQLSAAICAACFTLAFPLQFSGFRITMAWALEGAALAWLARRYATPQDGLTADAYSKYEIASWCVFALVFVRLAVFDTLMFRFAQSYSAVVNRRFLVFAVAAICLWIASHLSQGKISGAVLYSAGHFVALWGLALEADGWAARNFLASDAISISAAAITILGGCYALGLVSSGVILRRALDRQLGLALIGLTILKLYLYDIWTLSRGFRITAFLGLGALLLVVSYLYSRFKPAIARLWREPSAAVVTDLGHESQSQ